MIRKEVESIRSYIKIYGPPIEKAIIELKKVAVDLPTISKGDLSRSMIPSGETMMGDFDFVFHWAKDPDETQLRKLIASIDEALKDLGCRYTITTSVDASYPYRL